MPYAAVVIEAQTREPRLRNRARNCLMGLLVLGAASCGIYSNTLADPLAKTCGVSLQGADSVIHITAYSTTGAGAECNLIEIDAQPQGIAATLESPMAFTPTCTFNDGAILVSVYASDPSDAYMFCSASHSVGPPTAP
jgi:hypothetical protein